VEQLVIATELEVVSEQEKVAILTLHTMAGRAEFGINGDVARGLIEHLTEFLNAGAKPS
jgi:hypothetical protein